MRNITFWLVLLLQAPLLTGQLQAATVKAQTLDHIVAVVNDDVILRSELDKYLRGVIRQLQRSNTRPPDFAVMQKQGLERLIVRSLQLQRAGKTGIQVDDATLNRSIRGIARKNGMTLERFRQALVTEGINYADFREDIRNEIIITRLKKRDVINRINISQQEINDYIARQKVIGQKNRLVRFAHILISLPDAASTEQVEQARQKGEKVIGILKQGADFSQTAVAYSDGQKAMEGGVYDFRPLAQVPPLFSKVLNQLKTSETSKLFRSPYGFHILKLVETRGQAKHIVNQTKLRHILIRTTALISNEDARTRLQRLKNRIEQGDDFAALARSHSDDTLSAKEGGSLGWIGPGDTVPKFEQAYVTLTTNEISEPFQSRYGWHIVQVLERRQHDDTNKFQRTKAINNIKKQKTAEEMQTWLRRLRDEAYVEYKLDNQHAR